MAKVRRLTLRQRASVVRWYIAGHSTLRIAKKLKANPSAINGLLRRRGVKMRSGAPPRIHQIWDGKNHDDGWVDNRGRFRVYRPDCPRAYASGYALRAHVVWWLYHGKPHPRNKELHHIDENRLNDAMNNLELLPNSTHQSFHKSASVVFHCRKCGKEIVRSKNRMRYSNNYCSQKCYSAHARDKTHGRAISRGLKKAYEEGRR